MIENSKFISAKIEHNDNFPNDENNNQILIVTYEVEKKNGIYEKVISVPIYFSNIPEIVTYFKFDCVRTTDYDINFGFGPLDVGIIDKCSNIIEETLIKEKIEEMSLEEIEQELGHKVKIVNKNIKI